MTATVQTKFTPGPWRIVPNHSGNGTIWIGIDHPEVGEVSHAEVRAGCDEAGELGSADANARLIAAAPDLYAALRDTLDAFEAFMRDTDWGKSSLSAEAIKMANEAPARARAALAKAGA